MEPETQPELQLQPFNSHADEVLALYEINGDSWAEDDWEPETQPQLQLQPFDSRADKALVLDESSFADIIEWYLTHNLNCSCSASIAILMKRLSFMKLTRIHGRKTFGSPRHNLNYSSSTPVLMKRLSFMKSTGIHGRKTIGSLRHNLNCSCSPLLMKRLSFMKSTLIHVGKMSGSLRQPQLHLQPFNSHVHGLGSLITLKPLEPLEPLKTFELFSVDLFSFDLFFSCVQDDWEPQTQPRLQLQQQLVGLDVDRQILLLSATDVIETLLLRLNHYFEEWKKPRNLLSGPSIPSSYSDMVYIRHKSQLSRRFIEAMDCVESKFLRDLEIRGYAHAIKLKEPLRQDLTVYLTKAKGEGGRNDVAHPFSTSVKQYWKNPSRAPGKVRCLLETAVSGLTQSQKDYNLRILSLLSNSRNLPECYRDLAEVAFPLQIFFLRDVMEKSKVKLETVGGQ